MNKLVSIIIVNWNGKKNLQKCLFSVFRQEYRKIEVVLVDNASKDGSVEYVKSRFPEVKIIINKGNLGFAQANNIGYNISRGEYVLFLNNDTQVTKKFLLELIKVIRADEKIGGVQGKIFMMDDRKRLDTVGSFLTSTGFLYHYGFAKKDSSIYRKQIDIYSAKGAAMLFRRSVLEKVKVDGEIFDGRYFAYFEETDLCHRVWLSGYRIVFVQNSIIYHKIGATSRELDSAFVQYHSFKNRINSYIKNLGEFNLIKILSIHIILCCLISLMYLIRRKLKIFWVINKAILWNIGNLGPTLGKRQYIQHHIRKVHDRMFFPTVSKSAPVIYYWYTFNGDLGKYKEER